MNTGSTLDVKNQDSLAKFFQGKQPSALFLTCFVNIWERFSFYVAQGILVLYMTKELLFSNQHAYVVFSAFSALIYLTPLFGGHMADKLLGRRHAVLLGGFLLTVGYALLSLAGMHFLYLGLSVIIVGSGFFTPNIAALVGQLYQDNDPRREGGFSIFYAAINFGAFLPPIIVAGVIIVWGWHAAFLLAAIMVFIGTTSFTFLQIPEFHIKTDNIENHFQRIFFYIGIIIAIVVLTELVKHYIIANILLSISCLGFVGYALKKSFTYSRIARNQLLLCFFLTLFSVMFWVLYQQSAMSLTIFTEYNVDRSFFSWIIPTISFQSLNPLFIILCAPILSKIWIWLDRRNLNPSTSAKFALGTLLMGFAFLILCFAIKSSLAPISLWWLVLSYFMQSIGELFLSPVGLSMITTLSPKVMVGLMMGVWYSATAWANALAGFAAELTASPSGINDPSITSSLYSQVFFQLGGVSIILGMIALLFAPMLTRMIKV